LLGSGAYLGKLLRLLLDGLDVLSLSLGKLHWLLLVDWCLLLWRLGEHLRHLRHRRLWCRLSVVLRCLLRLSLRLDVALYWLRCRLVHRGAISLNELLLWRCLLVETGGGLGLGHRRYLGHLLHLLLRLLVVLGLSVLLLWRLLDRLLWLHLGLGRVLWHSCCLHRRRGHG